MSIASSTLSGTLFLGGGNLYFHIEFFLHEEADGVLPEKRKEEEKKHNSLFIGNSFHPSAFVTELVGNQNFYTFGNTMRSLSVFFFLSYLVLFSLAWL